MGSVGQPPFVEPNADDEFQLTGNVADSIRVPILGSPPRDWGTLRDVAANAAIPGAVVFGVQAGWSPGWLLLAGAGQTVIVKVVNPVLDVVGGGTAALLKRRFDQALRDEDNDEP